MCKLPLRFLVLVFMLPTLFVPTAIAQAVAVELKTLQLESGRVSGVLLDEGIGLTVFRGIPYAAPPTGDLRWKPPQAVPPWEGTRECNEFGARCVQGKKPGSSEKQSEDCLFLNVWTTNAGNDAKRPVMVWIHGGGFNSGGGDGWITNGSNFAQRGVVLVTINYRLGPLGFLAHPQLSGESEHGVSGNYGFLDQIAALKWVQRNISTFGGDENNVTIFGESAGGTSVSVLCCSPLANGLFHRAILQSPWMSGRVNSMTEPVFADLKKRTADCPSCEQLGQRWAGPLVNDSEVDSLAQLRSLDARELVAANGSNRSFPAIDGWLLPDAPEEIFAKGLQADVPVMIGTTKDEGNLFAKWVKLASRKKFIRRLEKYYGDQAEVIAATYPGHKPFELRLAVGQFITDGWFVRPARRLLRGMKNVSSQAYQYEFTKANPQFPALGAMHGSEIRYVFNTHNSSKSGKSAKQLAESMIQYWISFATIGDPNAEGLPHWPNYDDDSERYLELGDKIQAGAKLRKTACDVLDSAEVDRGK